MAVESLTYSDFVNEIVNRLDGSYTAKDVKTILGAFKDEAIDCVANGYKVSIPSFLRLEPKFVPAKRRGELVRNPSTGEMAPRAEGKPASFRVKAYASSSISKHLPSTNTKAGKALIEALS